MKTIDISGFGGGYEAKCQAMLIAGMDWLKKHLDFDFSSYKSYKHIYGVATAETSLAKELDGVLLAAAQGNYTGAMHQAVVFHLGYIHVHDYENWLEKAREKGREIIDVYKDDIENQVLISRIEWQIKLDNGYNPMAELFKKISPEDIISVDPSNPDSMKKAVEEIVRRLK